MSIRTRNVHFSTWAKVQEALNQQNINVTTEAETRAFLTDNSNRDSNPFYYFVGYIKSTREIYTHGRIYDCSTYDDTQIRDLIEQLSGKLDVLSQEKADLVHTHSYTDIISDIPDKILVSSDNSFVLKDISELMKIANSSMQLKFYCIEPVTIQVNSEEPVTFAANSAVNLFFADGDVFTITPTSVNSIMTLDAWPGALGEFYDWLEGVQVFNNIIFDMNSEDMYTKWNQNNQDAYHVQKAQYTNCVFWSDNPYINDIAIRTNYTLYNSFQLPLCYSTIPANTFKPFYLAYGVKSDPNWSNQAYIDSFAACPNATAPFSYYGMGNVSIFNMAVDPITLPVDCRGLMFYSPGIERAGTFDASKTTKFGAKQGSWREAFGFCNSLKTLYILNLKASLNLSWSPLEIDSLEYIIDNAANTSAITISLSPYTWYRLTDAVRTAATEKNITLALITTNYQDDSRFGTMLTKEAQTLSSDEIEQVQSNLGLNWSEY